MGDESFELIQALVSTNARNPEEMVIDQENLEFLESCIEQELSSFEMQVLELYLTGMSYTEIARVLGKTDKATDNAMHRVKTKIKSLVNHLAE